MRSGVCKRSAIEGDYELAAGFRNGLGEFTDVEQDFGTHRMDGLSQWASDYPIIMLNSALSADRKRLTLAHELGHLVLHNTYIDADMEAQPIEFAAELLMPAHIIESEFRNLTPAKLLAMKQVWAFRCRPSTSAHTEWAKSAQKTANASTVH